MGIFSGLFGSPPSPKAPPQPPSLPSVGVQLAALRQKRAAAAGGMMGGTMSVSGSPQIAQTAGSKTLLGA